MKLLSLCILSSILLSSAAFAGDCSITIDRTPCPGKEAEARKPYDGKNPTTDKAPKATTAEACIAEGEKSVKIVRKGTLSKKSAKITFDGKALAEKADEKDCK
jgi:hypothetical protein